jgi:hypothetical protein
MASLKKLCVKTSGKNIDDNLKKKYYRYQVLYMAHHFVLYWN